MNSHVLEDLQGAIGRTPLLEIHYEKDGRKGRVFAKLESENLTGSVKDRMALYVLKKALEQGELTEDCVIAEATSGNTGIAFSALGAALDLPVVIFMPSWMSEERKRLIASFGATIREVSREEGGFEGSIALANAYTEEGKTTFLPRQFDNEDNVLGQYESLGKELVADLEALDLVAGAFVAGVGTGGTVMGAGRALREKNPAAKIHPLEPLESPVLSNPDAVDEHRIAGISDEFVPSICDLKSLDEVVSISDSDSILAAQALAKKGLGVGISSGANLLGAIALQERYGSDAIVTTVFADDNKKYLSTDLLKDEPMREDSAMKGLVITKIIAHRH